MATARWSWGDEGLAGSISARLAPQVKSLEQTRADLEGSQAGGAGTRPVVVILQEAQAEEGSGRRRSTQHMQFRSVEAAIAGVTACMASGAVSLAAFFSLARRIVPDQLALAVRWRWDDVGLTSVASWYRTLADLNPVRWTQEKGLGPTQRDLAEYAHTEDANRPVALELRATGRDCSALTFATAVPAVADAIAMLDELSMLQRTLKSRDEFLSSANDAAAQTGYDEYALHTMEANGGFVGASVRFTSPDPYCFVARGAEGVIESFTSINSLKVDWGSHSASVSMSQCTLVATADATLSLADTSADAVRCVMMRQVAAKLRSSFGDPQAFERLCLRLTERHRGPQAGAIAVEGGVCEAVLEAMDRDRAGTPQSTLQHAGCLLLWWVCTHDSDDNGVRACKAHAVEAGVLTGAIAAQKAFPELEQLSVVVRRLVAAIAEGSPHFREMALAAGAAEEWLM